MRLLVDENLQQPTVEHLRRLGHDASWVRDEGLASVEDDAVFRQAQESGRVLLTYNVDFADLRNLIGTHHCGIVRLRISNQRLHVMHPILEAALDQIQHFDLKDTLVTVSDRRVRIRKTFSA